MVVYGKQYQELEIKIHFQEARQAELLPKCSLILTEFAADGNKCIGANMRESVRHVIGGIALTI